MVLHCSPPSAASGHVKIPLILHPTTSLPPSQPRNSLWFFSAVPHHDPALLPDSVAGVPIGNDEWVQQFVLEKAIAVQVDVGKLEMISDGLVFEQMLRFCQNTRLTCLGCNTPTLAYQTFLHKSTPQLWRCFAEKVKLTRMVNVLLSFVVFLTSNCNCHTFGEGLVSLPMLVVPFLLSMRHLCLSCNGSIFAVILSRISLILPAHGPQAKI